jgi:hypothetical protein
MKRLVAAALPTLASVLVECAACDESADLILDMRLPRSGVNSEPRLDNADGAASARRRMPPRLREEPLQTVAGL